MTKDDPLQQTRPKPRVLLLNHENMQQARDNWWKAYRQIEGAEFESDNATTRSQRDMWDVAWAAAAAFFTYALEGRVEPR